MYFFKLKVIIKKVKILRTKRLSFHYKRKMKKLNYETPTSIVIFSQFQNYPFLLNCFGAEATNLKLGMTMELVFLDIPPTLSLMG